MNRQTREEELDDYKELRKDFKQINDLQIRIINRMSAFGFPEITHILGMPSSIHLHQPVKYRDNGISLTYLELLYYDGIAEGRALQREEDRESLDAAGEDVAELQQENTALKQQIATMQMTEEEAKILFNSFRPNLVPELGQFEPFDRFDFITLLKQRGLIKKED
jgi:hypothetical protein